MKFFLKHSVIFPTLICAFATSYWLVLALQIFNIHDFIYIGRFFIQRSNNSPIISSQLKYSQQGFGYDGQFFYYFALDPYRAFSYIDDPPYRIGRVLYPLAARLLSFGKENLVALNLLIINILSVLGTVFLLSNYLKRYNLSPYYSLIYGFYPGVYVSLGHDLNEPMAYFLTMAGVYFFDAKRLRRLAISAAMFILAIFTREATAIFSVAFMGSLVFKISDSDQNIALDQHWKKGLVSTLLILIPYFLFVLFLNYYYSPDRSPHLSFPPILNLLWPWSNAMTLVMLPSLILGIIPIKFFRKGILTAAVAVLSIQILLLISLIPDDFSMYANIGRYANGLVLAATLCLPDLVNFSRRLISLVVAVAFLWFQAWIFTPQFIAGQQIGIYVYYIAMIIFVSYFYTMKSQPSRD